MEITVRTALIQIINGNFDKKSIVKFADCIENEEICLDHATSYIKAIQTGKRAYYENFIEEMKYHDIKVEIEGRSAKIEARKLKNDFLSLEIDLDDFEYVESLFRYLYVLASEEVEFLKQQEEFEHFRANNKDFTRPKLENTFKCIQIDDKGRKEVLINRIQPTLSLDEYADMVLDNMKKREAAEKRAEQNRIKLTEHELYEKQLQELIEMDDFKDNMAPGNTYRQA